MYFTLRQYVFRLKKEANMVPKQYFEFGDAGLRDYTTH